MSNYIKSGDIKVFPCANRGGIYSRSARLTTEYNLTSIINKLVDSNFFVVTGLKDTEVKADESLSYIFNIRGYLFDTTAQAIYSAVNTSEFTSGVLTVYAGIITETLYTSLGYEHAITTEEMVSMPSAPSSTEDPNVGQAIDRETSNGEMEFTGLHLTTALPENPIEAARYCKLIEFEKQGEVVRCNTPQEALLKFRTNLSGSQRSVAIDDGIL